MFQIEKDKAVYVNKGTNSHIDSYSAFWDNKKLSQTELLQKLTKHGITDVYVCGLAYDICVGKCGELQDLFKGVLMSWGGKGRVSRGVCPGACVQGRVSSGFCPGICELVIKLRNNWPRLL